MPSQEQFILTPISVILEDAVSACSGLGKDMAFYAVGDYLLQSIMLRLTGVQEQKMKSITWELASVDPSFRRKLLKDDLALGEYSNYDAKNRIYKELINIIKEFYGDDPSVLIDHKKIVNNVKNKTKDIFHNSNLKYIDEKGYNFYIENFGKIINTNQFAVIGKQDVLFQTVVGNYYKVLYAQRNRIAHNIKSFQQHKPTLRYLSATANENVENYFIWFAILILIDEIFIELYKILKEVINDSQYYIASL